MKDSSQSHNPRFKKDFLAGKKKDYSTRLEKIRKTEYPLLKGKCNPRSVFQDSLLTVPVLETTYLDHAGTTLYPKSLMEDFANDMNSNLLGNPHSNSPSSVLSTRRVEAVRARMLEFFRTDLEHFDLVFVANATAAIKLVMDGMRGSGQGETPFWYGYHADSHTSLVGVREHASAASRCFSSDQDVETWLSQGEIGMPPHPHRTKSTEKIGLFAYPAQSNMNGRRLPLSWPGRIRASQLPQHHHVFSLLDAAAFVSTAQLDLSNWDRAPDFIALSFYKIFGFPDLGALLVRKGAGHVLARRPYFGGGTVDMVINAVNNPDEAWYARKDTSTHEAFEDGTQAFHSILALDSALKIHHRIYKSMDQVSRHTTHLVKILYDELSALSHNNDTSLCTIYQSKDSTYGDSKTQGPTIAFNVQDCTGRWIGKTHFEKLAILYNIQMRTGGVCNPGGIAHSLKLDSQEMRYNFAEGLRCGNDLDELNGKPTGIIRVSLGAMSSIKDVKTMVNFMRKFIDKEMKKVEWDTKAALYWASSPLESEAFLQSKSGHTDQRMAGFGYSVAICTKAASNGFGLIKAFLNSK